MSNQKNVNPFEGKIIDTNDDLGLTQEYNRKLYEGSYGEKRKKEFKDQYFGNKSTSYDPISGKVLHKKQTAAKNKYGERQWPIYSAEVDHITSIEDVYSYAKKNPFLTDKDLQEIINSNENLRISSKTMNASKQNKSDFNIVREGKKKRNNIKDNGKAYYEDNNISIEGKKKIVNQKIKSDIFLHKNIGKKTIKNVTPEVYAGAANALYNNVIPLTSRAVDNMCQAAIGEITLKEAVVNVSKDAVDIAVLGSTTQIAKDFFKNSNYAILQNVVESNKLAQMVQVALIVKDSAIKYINGEITGEEFIEEVGAKGTKMVAGLIGAEIGKELGTVIGGWLGTLSIPIPGVGTGVGIFVGRAVGEILGTIITTVACSAIMAYHQTIKHLKNYKKYEKEIANLERKIVSEMKIQRDKFENIIRKEFNIWNEKIENGFQMIIKFSCEETFEFEKVNEGLDLILSIFGTETKYKTADEFKETFGKKLILKI